MSAAPQPKVETPSTLSPGANRGSVAARHTAAGQDLRGVAQMGPPVPVEAVFATRATLIRPNSVNMGRDSAIEWTGHTFNPWWGCTKVSPACDHCYAETWARRTGFDVWGADAPRRYLSDDYWSQPLLWDHGPCTT